MRLKWVEPFDEQEGRLRKGGTGGSMSKKQTVLKDFSQLKIEKRIELSAIGIYQIVFRGEMERAFEPKKGTEMHRVYKMKRLDLRQQRAWKLFRDDVDNARGKSGSVCSAY